MTEWISRYGLFIAELATVAALLVALLVVVAAALRARARGRGQPHLEVHDVGERLRELEDAVNAALLPEPALKQLHRQRKRERRQRRHRRDNQRPRLFVLDFEGDLEASRTQALREEINAVLQVAKPQDAVLLRLESAGGLVHGYGLAASQLVRLRDHGLRLTVAVDKVAASGGYLMACVADRIIAAPFAVVGSIGVVAQLPNFNRWLKRRDIDFELHTAGQYKRTLTLFGENTPEAREKFVAELEQTHALFKAFVAKNRPQLAVETVATGEHWYGTQALALKLVDQIQTSDDFLLAAARDHDVFELRYQLRPNWRQRLLGELGAVGIDTSALQSWRPPRALF